MKQDDTRIERVRREIAEWEVGGGEMYPTEHAWCNTRDQNQRCIDGGDNNIGDTIVAVVDSIQRGCKRERPPEGEGVVCCGLS